MSDWERRYFRVLNAFMRVLLRSPLHRLRSKHLVLLEFRGRRTGKRYSMPVSYWQPDPEQVICLSSAVWAKWWRNLDGAEVAVWLRGAKRLGKAELIDDRETRRSVVTSFLNYNAHDAQYYEVPTDARGAPDPDATLKLADAAETKVISIALAPTSS
jgi:hypothetical protein